MRRVWDTDSPGKVPPSDPIEFHPSRLDETKLLEYVKVYKDKNDERLDFSEESGDEVKNNRVLDSGEQMLHTD